MKKHASDKLWDALDSIRAKPEPARWAIVIGVAGVAAVILLAFWAGKLGTGIQYVAESEFAPNQELKSLLSPLSAAKESLQALKAGQNISQIAENLEKIEASPSRELSNLEEPPWFRRGLNSAGAVLDFNLVLMGTAFMDMVDNVKNAL